MSFLVLPNVPSQDAKVKPTSMPNKRLRYQECQDPLAAMPTNCNPRAMDNDRGLAAEGVARKIDLNQSFDFTIIRQLLFFMMFKSVERR